MNPPKRFSISIFLASALVAANLTPLVCLAQDSEKKKPVAVSLPKFKTPPGKAQRKQTAGTRSGEEPVKLTALTPETHGLTNSAQPAFFWHQSDSAKPRQMVFTIYEQGMKKNLAKVPLNKAYTKGINRLDLGSLKVSLTAGKSYNWSVSFVTSRKSPSLNGVAKGSIKFAAPPAKQAAELKGATAARRATIYAETGAWHDLLAALDDLIKQDPKNSAVIAQRDGLLGQVGLGGVVE